MRGVKLVDRPKIIAVDFDGCIVTNRFPEVGKINEKLVNDLREEKKKGTIIIIWTCRSGKYIKPMVNFLNENKIPFDYINENVPWLPFETSRKIYADYYYDDRAVLYKAEEDSPEKVRMVIEKDDKEAG